MRPNTTDDKVIEEVLTKKNEYQSRSTKLGDGFAVEKTDHWLDLGANIGTFLMLAISAGGTVVAVEPEPENIQLLKQNLSTNFPDGAFAVVEAGVAVESGTGTLHLCNTDRNKYRHSMVEGGTWAYGNKSIEVPTVAFTELLSQYPNTNAVKMDIEAMEIFLLESLSSEVLGRFEKLVFEYTFDFDSNIPRFYAIIDKLNIIFTHVHIDRKVDRSKPTYEKHGRKPQAVMVYCLRSPQQPAPATAPTAAPTTAPTAAPTPLLPLPPLLPPTAPSTPTSTPSASTPAPPPTGPAILTATAGSSAYSTTTTTSPGSRTASTHWRCISSRFSHLAISAFG